MKNKIHNINCFDGFKLLEDKSINHVFTSPPYNRKRNDKYEHHNDIIEDYYGFLCNTIDECLRVSKDYVFFNIMKNYYNKQDVFKLIGKYSEQIVDIIIWEKTNPLPANGNNITNAYEFVIVFGDKPLKSNTTYTKNILSTSINNQTSKEHKAIMNQEVSDWFIEKFTQENDVILDCFMGTGTTAISCMQFNRKYIGFELQPEYVETANKRIHEHLNLNRSMFV
jgi:DNA modification methylase